MVQWIGKRSSDSSASKASSTRNLNYAIDKCRCMDAVISVWTVCLTVSDYEPSQFLCSRRRWSPAACSSISQISFTLPTIIVFIRSSGEQLPTSETLLNIHEASLYYASMQRNMQSSFVATVQVCSCNLQDAVEETSNPKYRTLVLRNLLTPY